jgi:hypothetical protein
MSRQDFLKNVMKGPAGESTQKNIDFWSNRATANSQCAPHASDGPMKLPSTKVTSRDTNMRPYKSQADSMVKEALADIDIVGSSPFMRSVRRGA